MEHNGYWYLFVSWDSCCDGENSTYKVRRGPIEIDPGALS